jgi:hypothetical protein
MLLNAILVIINVEKLFKINNSIYVQSKESFTKWSSFNTRVIQLKKYQYNKNQNLKLDGNEFSNLNSSKFILVI